MRCNPFNGQFLTSIIKAITKTAGGEADKVKMTGWLQWTLARTTLSMYNNTSAADKLKLALDIEDVILSVDVERVYHKLKLKVATASVYHYVR